MPNDPHNARRSSAGRLFFINHQENASRRIRGAFISKFFAPFGKKFCNPEVIHSLPPVLEFYYVEIINRQCSFEIGKGAIDHLVLVIGILLLSSDEQRIIESMRQNWQRLVHSRIAPSLKINY